MRARNISIQFERQEHQDKCIESILNALEERQDGHSLRLVESYPFIKLFPQKPNENRMDILMETGTGKTYAYIKAVFEIHKKFGRTKFVIIVPRMSIRHGVMQNIKQTADHFFSQYHKRLRCVSYPDEGLSSVVNSFIETNDLSVLLITNSAFNSRDNRINKHVETLYGTTTVWKKIVDLSPIVIMDEPHLLTGRQTTAYLKELYSNSLVMRFGATYPKNKGEDGLSNVVYSLDSISAFNKKLVKRINVSVVSSRSEDSDVHVTGTCGRKKFGVVYTINGQRHKTDVCLSDDLGAVTGLASYHGRSVTNITPKEIVLDDGRRLRVGAYDLAGYEIRQMVRYAISQHFERERELFHMGIKALSLFFIPSINDFRRDGRIKKIFEDEYVKARQRIYAGNISEEYRAYLNRDYRDDKLLVHDGYFSGDRERLNEKEEAKAVDIILKDRERLLSLDEPLRFIFSVWALREGWDNPNVFNICKLSHSTQDNSRRQQVGRGLRIAVNQHGMRMTEDRLAKQKAGFYEVNELNMIVPAYESAFIEDIQREIHDASPSIAGSKLTLDSMKRAGLSDIESSMLLVELFKNNIIDSNGNRLSSVQIFLMSNRDLFPGIGKERLEYIADVLKGTNEAVVDGNKSRTVHVRPDKWKKFRDLWESINRDVNMVYKNIDDEYIIQRVCKSFNDADIPAARTTVARWVYDSDNDTIRKITEIAVDDSDYFQNSEFSESIMQAARDNKWPIRFLLKIFNRLDLAKFKSNPEEAQRLLVEIMRDVIHHTILEKVEYRFAETTVYGNGLQREDGSLRPTLPATKLGSDCSDEVPPDLFLYNTAVYDSKIEQRSIRDISAEYGDGDRVWRIAVFAKLPRIDIPTPYKTYNPDFAYVISRGDGKSLFLVVETKGYDNEADVPQDEMRKIEYGRRFFKSLQSVLPENVKICFKRRLNVDDMSAILRECYE